MTTPIIPKADEVLLPCPFCGAKAKAIPYDVHGLMGVDFGCSDSACPASRIRTHKEMWNTRAHSPAVGGEVTWEEAEQVAQQFCNTAIGVRSWSKFCHVEQLDIIVEMRAALEAFVRGRGRP